MKAFNIMLSRSMKFNLSDDSILAMDWRSVLMKDIWASSEVEAKKIFLNHVRDRFSLQLEIKDENTIMTKGDDPKEYKIEVTGNEITYDHFFKRTVTLKKRPLNQRPALFEMYCNSFGKGCTLLKKDPYRFKAVFYRGEPSDNFKEELQLVFN